MPLINSTEPLESLYKRFWFGYSDRIAFLSAGPAGRSGHDWLRAVHHWLRVAERGSALVDPGVSSSHKIGLLFGCNSATGSDEISLYSEPLFLPVDGVEKPTYTL